MPVLPSLESIRVNTYNSIAYSSMILAFRKKTGLFEGCFFKKEPKSLFISFLAYNFKAYLLFTICQLLYCYISKKITVENKNNNAQPQKLQMNDILIPNAKLSAFEIEMNEGTKKLIEETQRKQDEALKRKEVNEEQLRKVVQL